MKEEIKRKENERKKKKYKTKYETNLWKKLKTTIKLSIRGRKKENNGPKAKIVDTRDPGDDLLIRKPKYTQSPS